VVAVVRLPHSAMVYNWYNTTSDDKLFIIRCCIISIMQYCRSDYYTASLFKKRWSIVCGKILILDSDRDRQYTLTQRPRKQFNIKRNKQVMRIMRISDTRDLCDFVSTHDTELDDWKFAVLFYVMSGVEALSKLSSIYPMIIFLPFWGFFSCALCLLLSLKSCLDQFLRNIRNIWSVPFSVFILEWVSYYSG
jgi:hypothetical protein